MLSTYNLNVLYTLLYIYIYIDIEKQYSPLLNMCDGLSPFLHTLYPGCCTFTAFFLWKLLYMSASYIVSYCIIWNVYCR